MRYAKRFQPSWKLRIVKFLLKCSWSLLDYNAINFQANTKKAKNGLNEIIGYKLVVNDFEIFEFKSPEPNQIENELPEEFPEFVEEFVKAIDADYIKDHPSRNPKEQSSNNQSGTDPKETNP